MDELETLNDLLQPRSDSTIESHPAAKGVAEVKRTGASAPTANAPQASMVKPTPLNGRCTIEGDRVEFFNPRSPAHELQSEKPVHRAIALMAMTGQHKNVDIARELGVTPAMVNYVLLQPWAIRYMQENMHNHGMQKVETLLKGAVADAVERLITEMDNEKNRGSERISAAVHIIERVYGRAVQPIAHTQVKPSKQLSDAELQDEINRLEFQLTGRS